MSEKISSADVALEQKNSKKQMYRNIIVVLIIVIAATVFFGRDKNGAKIIWSETSVTVEEKSGTSKTLDYSAISSAYLADGVDYGTHVDGTDKKSVKQGTWENEKWGKYYLCINTSCDKCIVLESESETWVINYDTDDVTCQIFESMAEFLSQKGCNII